MNNYNTNDNVEVQRRVVGDKSWFSTIGFGTALTEVEKINKMTKKEMRNTLLDVMNLSGTSAMVDDPKKLRGIIAQITKTIMGDDYNKWTDFLKSELGSWDEGESVVDNYDSEKCQCEASELAEFEKVIDPEKLYDAESSSLEDVGFGSVGIAANDLDDLKRRLNNLNKGIEERIVLNEYWADKKLFSGQIYNNWRPSGRVGGFRLFYKLPESPYDFLKEDHWFNAWCKWYDDNESYLNELFEKHDKKTLLEEITRKSWLDCMGWIAESKKHKPTKLWNNM